MSKEETMLKSQNRSSYPKQPASPVSNPVLPLRPNILVRVTTAYPDFPLIRQTPMCNGRWNNHRFSINDNCEIADWWVVASGLQTQEICLCDSSHTIFIANEPPGRVYNPAFLRQFAYVITCDQTVDHPGKVHAPYGLPWWVGIVMDTRRPHTWVKTQHGGYSEFKSIKPFKKPKFMSVISSKLQNLPGHVQRVSFLKILKAHFKDKIDFFGYHENPLADKWDGLAPYRYHVCIENTICTDYWTEKISDPLLAFTVPVYYGCPNLDSYLPLGSYIPLNIENEHAAFEVIDKLIDEDPYERHLEKIAEARDLVLDKYNFFALLAERCHSYGKEPRLIKLLPENQFPRWRYWMNKLKHVARYYYIA